jgi:hypothetical protein
MEDLGVMCVVYVGKDAEELAVDVLDGGGEGLRKVVTCEPVSLPSLVWSGLTRFGGEHVLVVEQVLDPGHDVINIRRCGEVDALSILVDPSVIKAGGRSVKRGTRRETHALRSGRHGRTRVLRAALGDDPIKLVEVGIKVEDWDRMRTANAWRDDAPLTATHSMMSTYFGRTTMVLKLPLTRAASTKGLQR